LPAFAQPVRSPDPTQRSKRPAGTHALAALHELAVAASGKLEPEALAKLAVDQACALLGVDGAALYWWLAGTGQLHALADNRPYKASAPRTVKPGQGVAGLAFDRVEPVIIPDYPTWEGAVSWALAHGVKAAVGIPLLARGRAMGAMAVLTHTTRRFTADDIQLLSLLAAQVAPSLEAARLDADLGASEQRFRSLYGTLACGVLVLNTSNVILQANTAAEQMLGLSIDEMRGKTTTELWRAFREDGTELTSTERPGTTALRTRQAVHGFTMKVSRPTGRERWLQIDTIPVLGPDGEAVQVVSSFLDITERKRAEEALRQSEERFRAVFHRSAIGIARIDLQGRILEANPALKRMLGYDPKELAGRVLRQLLHPDHTGTQTLAELVELAEGKRDEIQLELLYLHQNGSVVWGNSIGSLVRGSNDDPLFIIWMIEDITARKAQAAALEHQALHDVLTDLPNRTLLYDRLHQAIDASKRQQKPLALLMMDLDRFKEVNDTFGHHCGDVVLRQLALRLRGQVRESDTIARLGGDEFAIILPGVSDEAAAEGAAVELLNALQQPFIVDGQRLEISASIGITLFPKQGEDADALLRRADAAMYAAKRREGGLAFYALDQDGQSRLSLSFELRRAIEHHQLVLHYQPALHCGSGQVAGAEALVHWPHPDHGLLGPDRFIPLAEQTGLIRPLGFWGLETAILQQQAWQRDGIGLRVAVNLSMRNLHDPQLLEFVARMLKTYAVAPRELTIEITESTLMTDTEQTLKILRSLKSMDVRVSIDDFGTGFSSLLSLRRFPIDEVKIDKSFVTEMASRKDDGVIVQSTIDLAHNLGLAVVAEGVEDQAAWDLLAVYGCDFAQGYYLCPPLPAPELAGWLRSQALRSNRQAAPTVPPPGP